MQHDQQKQLANLFARLLNQQNENKELDNAKAGTHIAEAIDSLCTSFGSKYYESSTQIEIETAIQLLAGILWHARDFTDIQNVVIFETKTPA